MILKPSNFQPNLQEIDVEQDNIFSCQVNTSGSAVMGYKMQVLSIDGGTTLYDGNATDLGSRIKNKCTLAVSMGPDQFGSGIVNGKDYQWNFRTYDAQIGSTTQPDTLVCTGYLVGSTKYVIWTRNNDAIQNDMYVEFKTTGSDSMMPILEPNVDNIVLPEDEEEYVERHKITWVDRELGWDETFTKIELDDSFKYNYVDGTSFTLYRCSDQHTLTSVYVDPNDNIERGVYIELNGDIKRKIIGYGEETGEVRVQEPFTSIPTNGTTFKLYSAETTTDESGTSSTVYTELTGTTDQVVGGTPITNATFTVITNRWDDTAHRLFIQPNINIKPDLTNPNELVFDQTGVRVDIIKTTSTTVIPGKTTDITFDKLDNTQWLLNYMNVPSGTPSIIPKSTYTVYTDFQDGMPYSIFYARKTPTITMQFKNYTDGIDVPYTNISGISSVPWRDIQFFTNWASENNVQVKYYQYKLYDEQGDLIAQSEETYDTELYWYFRGFQTSDYETAPVKYTIEIVIVDEYDKEFTTREDFNVFYKTEQGIVPLSVVLNCEEHALDISATTPVYVESTDADGKETVTGENVNTQNNYLNIPAGKILNYTNVINPEKTPIELPETFSFLTQFQITGDFLDVIPSGGETMVFEIAHDLSNGSSDVFTLTLGSFDSYYVTPDNTIVKNEGQFKFRIYKNNDTTPLTCFTAMVQGEDGNYEQVKQDYYNIQLNDIYQDFVSAVNPRYALQDSSEYTIVGAFPSRPQTGVKYLLTNDVLYSGVLYYQGAYEWIATSSSWRPITSDEYFFVESLSQIPGFSYDDLNAPSNTRNSDGNGLLYTEENNIWVDTGDYSDNMNKEALNKKWFTLYLIVDNTDSDVGEQVNCEIEINNTKI